MVSCHTNKTKSIFCRRRRLKLAALWHFPVLPSNDRINTLHYLILAVVIAISWLGRVASGAIIVPQKYSPPSFIRDIETMFEISQELPSNWLPVYLLHRSFPTTWRQDFPVYDFVHQFFVSAVSLNDSASVIVAELTPKSYGYSAEDRDVIEPINRVVTQIIGEQHLWYLFVFRNVGEGSISVGTRDGNSLPLFIEIYGSSKPSQHQNRGTSTTITPLPLLRPNSAASIKPFSAPYATNITNQQLPPFQQPQNPPLYTTRPQYSGGSEPSMFTPRHPVPLWVPNFTAAPPLLAPRSPPTYAPPPLLTPRPTAQVVVVGPGGRVMLWPSGQPPILPSDNPPPDRSPPFSPPLLPPPPPVPPPIGNPWLPPGPPLPIFIRFTTAFPKRLLKLNVIYLAVAFAILAFGTLALCLTLLTIFCCCRKQINEFQWMPGIPFSDTKSGFLFAFLIVLALVLMAIGVGVSYLHATHGNLDGKWYRPCRLSIAVVCCAVFVFGALAYAIAQFLATRTYLVPDDERPATTIVVAPANTNGRREAWVRRK